MRIPSNELIREQFFRDLIEKCMVSLQERKGDYSALRSWFLFGSGPEESPTIFNKIYPHIDQLTSFLYSAETTRFSINVGASVPDQEQIKVPRLTLALNDEWLNSNADQVFSSALTWALVFNSTFIKLVYNKGIHPYMVEPASIGVLREDTPYTDRQEALVHTYYITKSELYARLYSHPKREQIVKRITTSVHTKTEDLPEGVDRIIMSQSNPTIYGNVNLDLFGMNRYKARVAEETVKMHELWVWNDETEDYQVITMADPDVFIYDRPGKEIFLKGELPFVQICPNPQFDYYWGQSEVQRLVFLQQLRNNRMTEILDLLAKQVAPPTALTGFTGILDEKNFALNRAGGLLATDMPNAKAERLAPEMPSSLSLRSFTNVMPCSPKSLASQASCRAREKQGFAPLVTPLSLPDLAHLAPKNGRSSLKTAWKKWQRCISSSCRRMTKHTSQTKRAISLSLSNLPVTMWSR